MLTMWHYLHSLTACRCCSNQSYIIPAGPTAANQQQHGQRWTSHHFINPVLYTMRAVPICSSGRVRCLCILYIHTMSCFSHSDHTTDHSAVTMASTTNINTVVVVLVVIIIINISDSMIVSFITVSCDLSDLSITYTHGYAICHTHLHVQVPQFIGSYCRTVRLGNWQHIKQTHI